MTAKEATVYILDVGRSMGETHNGRTVTDLDWTLQYFWDKIGSAVHTGRKTLCQGVILAGTDGTKNALASDGLDGYDNLTVVRRLGQILMPDLRELQKKIKPSNSDEGDVISAIMLAVTSIEEFCKKLKYVRQIVLLTNATNSVENEEIDDQILSISAKLKKDGIKLSIIGVDFDDPEFGFKEHEKSQEKAANEIWLKQITEQSGGSFCTFAKAIKEIEVPRIKPVRPVHSYKGPLTLGDTRDTAATLRIEVERYPCIKAARPMQASSFALKTSPDDVGSTPTQLAPPSSMPVRHERTYRVEDLNEKKGYREVESDELEKGYEYGRTAVPLSKATDNVTKFETSPAFEIMGFVTSQKYKRYFHFSDTNYVVASSVDSTAAMALSSLIHALFEDRVYAVARLVAKEGRPPVIVLLAPSLDQQMEIECLLDVQLPFAEDCRQYAFPPLDKVRTVSGKVLERHRNLPDAELNKAMSAYVDAMDLMGVKTDDGEEKTEFARMKETYNPYIHRLNAAVLNKAIRPLDPLPKPPEILSRYTHPPSNVTAQAATALKALVTASDVKKVPPKTTNRQLKDRNAEKPLSGLDMDALLAQGGPNKKMKIDPSNAIPDLKQLLRTSSDKNVLRDAATQMTDVIEKHIRESFGDSTYGKAMAELRTLREEMLDMEEPNLYNEMARRLKKSILSGALDGDRNEAWWEMRRTGLGLLTTNDSKFSSAGEEDARLFRSTRIEAK